MVCSCTLLPKIKNNTLRKVQNRQFWLQHFIPWQQHNWLFTDTDLTKLAADGKSGKTSFSLASAIFVSQTFRTVSMEENKSANWLKLFKMYQHYCPPRPGIKKIIAKRDSYFIPTVNPDCTRCGLEKICQKGVKSIAQYHIRLLLQIVKYRLGIRICNRYTWPVFACIVLCSFLRLPSA